MNNVSNDNDNLRINDGNYIYIVKNTNVFVNYSDLQLPPVTIPIFDESIPELEQLPPESPVPSSSAPLYLPPILPMLTISVPLELDFNYLRLIRFIYRISYNNSPTYWSYRGALIINILAVLAFLVIDILCVISISINTLLIVAFTSAIVFTIPIFLQSVPTCIQNSKLIHHMVRYNSFIAKVELYHGKYVISISKINQTIFDEVYRIKLTSGEEIHVITKAR